MTKKFTGFIGVFEERLGKIKSDLKKELERAKTDRRKGHLKYMIKECKELRNLLKELKPKCPHCGGIL
jgi:tRNA G26 N,N-dimethylase Trm1